MKIIICHCYLLLALLLSPVFAADAPLQPNYRFASIEYLLEQELAREVIPLIYRGLGFSVEVLPLPGNRAQYAAVSGKLDGEVMRIWRYGEEHPTMLRVPTPYYYLKTMPFVRADSGIVIRKPKDLQPYRVVKVRGVKHTNNITEGLPRVLDVDSTKMMFELLRSNKADVALTNHLDGQINIKRYHFGNISEMPAHLGHRVLYHYLHPKHARLLPVIDAEFKRLEDAGELSDIIEAAETRVIAHQLLQ
ncbi:ABC transporter substrate-binding protein [Shewanella colwelliana]|uniref:ABC transporter substrate-binding protein n=1 Tax=Shewanella colwelliana TaxID=23 RepID=A0ABQ4P592_SHECO|nr:transporter substrate-binding domain-containing protein [Shewanella colwelliana]GIU42683.1 ABC transporter substrate-binding protein [Shewanella colwelliana]